MNPANEHQNELLSCRRCRRLSNQLARLRQTYPDYWNKPVPARGDRALPLLIIGLAPGLHGANRTGVPFEGDASGQLLHAVLEELALTHKVSITNAVKCLPVKNLPSQREVRHCSRFLDQEINHHRLNHNAVLLLLGGVAHRAVISLLGLRQAAYPFSHGAIHRADGLTLVDSYHCSRYNTQTGRLTYPMFLDVVRTAGNMAYP